jgi:REP element-mobilizing transposase RayT
MQQRCRVHDYRAPCIYMITLATEPRRNCLGRLEGEQIRLSPVGEMVRESWMRSADIYPGVQPGICAVMPDHFHGLLRVKERLAKPMGQVVRGFKAGTTFLWLRDFGGGGGESGAKDAPQLDGAGFVSAHPLRRLAPTTLWQRGFQDTILLRRGQLKTMRQYILDNPRRLAIRREHPDLFTQVAQLTHGCAGIGNRFLLERPVRQQVQVSRSISPEALAEKQAELLHAAAHGAVLVSPGISPGEKQIARAALEAHLPLVVLLENGFAPFYKPPGRYWDACAAGRLLMLAPWPHHDGKRVISREQCLALNRLAADICR